MHGEAHDLGRVRGGSQPRGHRRPDASAFWCQQLIVERVADHLSQATLRLGLTLRRDEVHAERRAAQHELGIDVGVTRSHAEVQRRVGRADDAAARDLLAFDDRDRREEGVARAQAVGVADDDVQRAADLACELDEALFGREHWRAGHGAVVDAAVACGPLRGRRTEVVDDRRVDRRLVVQG